MKSRHKVGGWPLHYSFNFSLCWKFSLVRDRRQEKNEDSHSVRDWAAHSVSVRAWKILLLSPEFQSSLKDKWGFGERERERKKRRRKKRKRRREGRRGKRKGEEEKRDWLHHTTKIVKFMVTQPWIVRGEQTGKLSVATWLPHLKIPERHFYRNTMRSVDWIFLRGLPHSNLSLKA